MGTLYYARNTETKKAYELGKGAWRQIAENGAIDTSDVSKLSNAITENVITVKGGWAQEAVNDVAYHRMIAESLERLGNNLELVNDATWDDPMEGFELVGTRYLDDA